MACSVCMREYEDRPNDLCTNHLHWQGYVQSLDLTPEQRDIVNEREEKRKQRWVLIDQLRDLDPEDQIGRIKILDQMVELDSDICEHGRSICKPCLACEELDAKILGELCDHCDMNRQVTDGLCKECFELSSAMSDQEEDKHGDGRG